MHPLHWLLGVTLSTDKREPQSERGVAMTRASAQRASVAQLLLVTRLKARNRRDLAVDTLERGAHVIWVTCKSWFSSGQPPSAASSDDNTNKQRD